MPYAIEVRPAALHDMKRLPKEVLARVCNRIESLAQNPRPSGVEKLSGSGDSYRVRVGDYRILYRIMDQILLVVIVKVKHRREAYRR